VDRTKGKENTNWQGYEASPSVRGEGLASPRKKGGGHKKGDRKVSSAGEGKKKGGGVVAKKDPVANCGGTKQTVKFRKD